MSCHKYVAASREQHGSSIKRSGEYGTAMERCPRLCRSSSASCQQPCSYPSSAVTLNPPPIPRPVSPGEPQLALGRMLNPRSHLIPKLGTFLAGRRGRCRRTAALVLHKAGSERRSARRRDGFMHQHKTQACRSSQWGSGISQPVFVCGYGSVSIYPGYSSSE